jgi:hypothetical protein
MGEATPREELSMSRKLSVLLPSLLMLFWYAPVNASRWSFSKASGKRKLLPG